MDRRLRSKTVGVILFRRWLATTFDVSTGDTVECGGLLYASDLAGRTAIWSASAPANA